MGEPTDAAVARALALIRAAGRGDLLAPEPAGPSSRSSRPTRRASAGVAAAVVSCSSSPRRPAEQDRRGKVAEKGKGGKGKGGDKGKGPAEKKQDYQSKPGAQETVVRREVEEEEGGLLLEEGEIESESEEEPDSVPCKKSRREAESTTGRVEESEASEGDLETWQDDGVQGQANLQDQTGWYGQGRGEALDRRAQTDAVAFAFQRIGQEAGDGGARGQEANSSRGGPPDSPIFSLRDARGEGDSGITGEHNETLMNVWKNLLVESSQRLEGKLEKRLMANNNEMMMTQRNKENHWKQLLDNQTERLEKALGDSRKAYEKVAEENRAFSYRTNKVVNQRRERHENDVETGAQRLTSEGRGEESGRSGYDAPTEGSRNGAGKEGAETNIVVAKVVRPASAKEKGATEVAVLANEERRADAGNTLAGTPAVQGTTQTESCDEKTKSKKLPYMGRGKQLGAHLMKATKEKIWAGEYVEIFKLLHREIRAKEGSKEEERELARRPYVAENIENWISAFSILASVYCEKFPDRAVSLFKYMDIIRGAQTNFGGLAWLKYDEEFRARMSEDSELAWGQLDEDLWLTVMARPSAAVHTASGHVLPFTPFRGRPTFGVGSRSGRGGYVQSGAGGRGAGSTQGGPCWNFNRGFCNRPGCWFEHKCKVCGGAHPVTQCWGGSRGTGEGNKRGGRLGKGGYAS